MKLSDSYIKNIEIKGLWKKYDINWNLHPDVNILAGINGSGKSTILNLITQILQGGNFVENVENIEDIISEVNIHFYGNKTINIRSNQDIKKIPEIIPVSVINTFDQVIIPDFLAQNQYLPKFVKTNLDYNIFNLQRYYLSYQINLGKRIEQAFVADDNIDLKTKRKEIYGNKDLFLTTINQLFEKTGKKIESDKNNEIVFHKDGEILTPYQLSSGEKQVLIILLSVLIQDNQPYILIMDEPEISLHIDWQENLIKVIRELNNNVQIILTTHSPALVMRAWMDKVTEMEDITTLTRNPDESFT
jgi:ABC-type lipoprotein export system ATPase subunit